MELTFTTGDACNSAIPGKKILVHCCNDNGVMGAGIAGQIRKMWPHVNKAHVDWFDKMYNAGTPVRLGDIQLVKAQENLVICNLIGQKDMGMQMVCGRAFPPVRYEAFVEGFWKLREKLTPHLTKGVDITIICPRMGCGLAGGKWDKVEACIREVFDDTNIKVVVYDFE
jgi:O-acetyl-ADP-ribose deacetylase (regulator of RNase III)